jgi:MFS family permease
MTPVQAGIGFIPFTVPTFFSSIMVPRLTRRLGNSGVLLLALLLLAIGMYLLSHLTADAKYLSGLAWPMLLLGLGNGAALGPLTISGVAGVEARDAGAASGLVNMAHQLGGTLGLSIMVVVFAAAHQSQLDGKVLLAHQLSAGFAGCLVALLLAALVTLLCNLLPTQNKPTLAAAR